jgi:hypothetical protein
MDSTDIVTLLNTLITKMDNLTKAVESMEARWRPAFKKEWTVENYKKSILVKFDYNKDLIDFIKASELGGIWFSSMKAWMFPKSIENEVIEAISNKVNNWSFTDLRI